MSNDIEAHKKVCRHLYESLSGVFIDYGVSSNNFSLLEKLYKKTSPQTILISRISRLRDCEQKIDKLEKENERLKKLLTEAECHIKGSCQYDESWKADEKLKEVNAHEEGIDPDLFRYSTFKTFLRQLEELEESK